VKKLVALLVVALFSAAMLTVPMGCSDKKTETKKETTSTEKKVEETKTPDKK
jgi:hypothetical protein